MRQWIIDRYNEGQDKYIFSIDEYGCLEEKSYENMKIEEGYDFVFIDYYNFLFNPKWGFAKSFWLKPTKRIGYEYTHYGNQSKVIIENWRDHIIQMAISEDPLKYLEKFKDNT